MKQRQRGIALLMTLSVLVVLTAALMTSIEERVKEVQFVEASRIDFEMRLQARSSFRALSTVITQQGLWVLLQSDLLPYHKQANCYMGKQFFSYCLDLTLPLGPNAYFVGLRVLLLDSAFPLQYQIRAKKESGKKKRDLLFANLLEQIHAQEVDFIPPDSAPFLSALNDFIDMDSFIDKQFFLGPENYYNQAIPFEVKNRQWDRLSEVKILPSYKDLRINPAQLRRNFRIASLPKEGSRNDAEPIEAININLASQQEMTQFFARYKGLQDYATLYGNRQRLAELLSANRSRITGERFKISPEALFTHGSSLANLLTDEGIDLNPKEQGLLTSQTELALFEWGLKIKNRGKRARALVRFTWNTKWSKAPKKIELLELSLI